MKAVIHLAFMIMTGIQWVHAQGLPASPNVPQALSDNETLRPFNREDFSLAYDVFLGSGDVERAFGVAHRAVQKLPGDRAWRRKLARVAEWSQRPAVAAEQWAALFQLGDRSEDTVTSILRLSSMMEDPSVALQAWAFQAQRKTPTQAQWEEIFWIYENSSIPEQGSRFFEGHYKANKNYLLLEYAARLAEHAGDDLRAESLFMQRAALEPFSMDFILRAVVSLIRRDRMREALALMQTHEHRVAADAFEFWRMLGQVAWELREFDAAEGALQRFSQTRQATSADWSRLVFLVRQKHPAQAAELALDGYRRFGALDQLLTGLGIYAELLDVQAQKRVYRSLNAVQLAAAEQDARFLLMRAQFYQRQKMPALAWNDFRRVLQKNPQDTDAFLSSLWFLIDEQRTDELPMALKMHASKAANIPVYWLAYAAGNQVLGRHRDAVNWYRKALRRNPEDPLVLLNYADALERMRRAGMAARVRRHAWLLLSQKITRPVNVQDLENKPELLAWARLSLQNQPGDPGLQLVRQLVSQLRGVSSGPADASQTSALVLGWAILKEQYPNARSWMWMRYARQSQTAAPLWGRSLVALQLGDRPAMNHMLMDESQGLSTVSRYDMAYALGHVQQAQDIAFTGMSKQDEAEALHDRFRQHAPLAAHYVQIRALGETLGSLERQGVQLEARLVARPGFHLLLGWSRMQQSSNDPDFSPLMPESDRLDSIEAQWLRPDHEFSLALLRRNELQSYAGMRLRQASRLSTRLNLEAGLDYRTESILSLPLRVAGYENSLYARFNYSLGKREYLRIAPRLTQYYTQYDDYLGNARILELEAGYRIRTEYPDWRIRAYATNQNFSYDGGISNSSRAMLPATLQNGIASGDIDPVRYFIPESSTTWGACVSMGDNLAGQNLQTTYSRAWRPFLDVCLRHNTVEGDGYEGAVGLAGSLTGADHLSVQWLNSDGSVPGSAVTRSLAIRYRHYF
jgi:hypothetical protein